MKVHFYIENCVANKLPHVYEFSWQPTKVRRNKKTNKKKNMEMYIHIT